MRFENYKTSQEKIDHIIDEMYRIGRDLSEHKKRLQMGKMFYINTEKEYAELYKETTKFFRKQLAILEQDKPKTLIQRITKVVKEALKETMKGDSNDKLVALAVLLAGVTCITYPLCVFQAKITTIPLIAAGLVMIIFAFFMVSTIRDNNKSENK